jgi:predicted small metal-binding protein
LTIKLRCSDYGFECDFEVQGEVELVMNQFGRHTDEEHGIEYTKEALMQFILRKSR